MAKKATSPYQQVAFDFAEHAGGSAVEPNSLSTEHLLAGRRRPKQVNQLCRSATEVVIHAVRLEVQSVLTGANQLVTAKTAQQLAYAVVYEAINCGALMTPASLVLAMSDDRHRQWRLTEDLLNMRHESVPKRGDSPLDHVPAARLDASRAIAAEVSQDYAWAAGFAVLRDAGHLVSEATAKSIAAGVIEAALMKGVLISLEDVRAARSADLEFYAAVEADFRSRHADFGARPAPGISEIEGP